MGHDTSDSIKIYFVLIGYLIEYKKKRWQKYQQNVKEKQKQRQTDILN